MVKKEVKSKSKQNKQKAVKTKGTVAKTKDKQVKIKPLPIILSVLVIAVIGFLIFGYHYVLDLKEKNVKNNYGNLVDENVIVVVADYNDMVSVNYELTVDNEVKDSSFERGQPFKFVVGKGVVKGFTDGVLGMQTGEERTFLVSPEDGYGTDLSVKIEDVNYSLTNIMMYYYQETGEQKSASELVGLKLYTAGGGECTFKSYISELDFAQLNCITLPHELAGKTLKFRVQMLDIVKSN